jgi:endonuclease YncB( thermonuclease family)
MLFLYVNAYADLKVSDGDTITIDARKIRLYGIDSPESKQKCYYLSGEAWDCGLEAKHLLEELVRDQDVRCVTQSIDLYKREVAICYVGENDLNRLMVQRGMALSYTQYSKKYAPDELLAKKQFIGIWNSAFMQPEQFRRFKKYEAKNAKQVKALNNQ